MAGDHGLRIPARTPFLVAGAMLNEQLAAVLGTEARPASDGRLEYLSDLANDAEMATPEVRTAASVDAWIEHLLASRTLVALRALRPAPGDVVSLERFEGASQKLEDDHDEQDLRLVSSIDQEGRVHLRGPGQRAWPNTLTMVHRAGEASVEANAARETAQKNAAAGRRAAEATRSLSSAKARLLAPWRVREREALPRDVDALRGVVETARDERPIQAHLERCPWLLGALLGGSHGRWVRPQVSLAGKFIADFFIADADSTGIRWWLIELESPRARQRIQDGDFSAQARHAVHQIEQWRSWLSENSEMARRSTERHGLQLPDIEAGVPALILISRRHLIAEDESWKRRMLAGRGIQMHTYDWLLERASGGGPIGGWLR
jgi:hypothetical protein